MKCAKAGCECEMSFHNSGERGYPRVISVPEMLLNVCSKCGHMKNVAM